MQRFSFAAPELPGKDAMSVAQFLRDHPDEHRESRRRMGMTMERAYRMATPMGNFATVYAEGEHDFGSWVGYVMSSTDPLDQEFVRRLADVHGLSADQGPPAVEQISAWFDPAAHGRGKGLAFCAPLRPGAADAARAFAKVAFQDRVQEFSASRRALGQTAEVVFLNSTPMGDLVCVYLEGDDPAEANRLFAASHSAYDHWFKEECKKIFIEGIDFNEPLPPIETLFDWQEATVTA